MKLRRQVAALLALVVFAGIASGAPDGRDADAVLRDAGVAAGLCVVLGNADADLALALSRKTRFLVHALFADGERLAAAREAVVAAGVYGRVSADRRTGDRLPYADNLVNLLVLDGAAPPPDAEVLRVLCPGGAAWLGPGAVRRKPRPANIDEWTHWLHGADGNAVARDSVVGPPRHVQWVAGPRWQRHHESVASVMGVVSAKGRLFYLCDEGAAAVMGLPDRWSLVARDAFNGLELWKRPVADWGWKAWGVRENGGRFNIPIYISRRLVAVGDRVYVTLGFNAPLTALDARTGATLTTYKGTAFTDEILHHDGRLVLSVNRARQGPGRVAQHPPVEKDVVVIEADTGREVWRRGGYVGLSPKTDSFERITHLSLAVAGGRVFFLDRAEIIALDLKTGDELWRTPRPAGSPAKGHVAYRPRDLCTLVAHEDVVLLGQPEEAYSRKTWNRGVKVNLVGLAADTGKVLWSHPCGKWGPGVKPDVFIIGGLAWTHDADSHAAIGLDLKTGDVKRDFSTKKAFNEVHHHRCFRNKATERFLLTARRGIEFIDLRDETCRTHHWVRGTCRHGIVPCNGLVYVPPHPCRCYIKDKVSGFYALAPAGGSDAAAPEPADERLARGPAFGPAAAPAPKSKAGTDWPTYRSDVRRSGATAAAVPPHLRLLWQADVGGRLTAPTAAEGLVLVASADRHTVAAYRAADGTPAWRRTAGGRVDSPPTIHRGLVLFGSADGRVTCLRAADGALVWRFRAAPVDRRIVAFGQVESAWPVHGSVLVLNGVAYVAAGRSTHLDGTVHICAFDPATGRLIGEIKPLNRDPHGVADVLVSDGRLVLMRHLKYSLKADAASRRDARNLRPGDRAFTTGTLLDPSWFSRVGWSLGGKGKTIHELLVFDDRAVYGVRAASTASGFGGYFRPGRKGYPLVASERAGKRQGKRWSRRLPIRVVAMAVAGEVLFAAGPPDAVDGKDPWSAFDGQSGGVLRAIGTADGKDLAEYRLDAPPVYDGLAAADGRLLVSAADGRLLCFAGRGGG